MLKVKKFNIPIYNVLVRVECRENDEWKSSYGCVSYKDGEIVLKMIKGWSYPEFLSFIDHESMHIIQKVILIVAPKSTMEDQFTRETMAYMKTYVSNQIIHLLTKKEKKEKKEFVSELCEALDISKIKEELNRQSS